MATVQYQFDARPVPVPTPGRSLAGVAVADITPPPGMPKAGYSANAHSGQGILTRLKARAFFFSAENGQHLAIVQLDLLGGSLLAHQRVLELVGDELGLAASGLMLGATHTHAGPGQYVSSEFYNQHASNRGGFDPDYLEFLSQQIATALRQAHQSRQPARVATGTLAVWGLTRNRSLLPHVHNPRPRVRSQAGHAPLYAIDPRLSMLLVETDPEAGPPQVLGALLTFAMHATGISQSNDEYHGDIWGYLCRSAQQAFAQQHPGHAPIVVGCMEGTHGDVAPAIAVGAANVREARRVGEALAARALQLIGQLRGQGQRLHSLPQALHILDVQQQSDLPDPAIGLTLLAGATENHTPVIHRLPPFRAGSRLSIRALQGEHGHKLTLGPRAVRNFFFPRQVFPHLLPLQVLKIGDWVLAGLPFELTLGAGQCLEQAVRDGLGGYRGVVSVSSVANDYWGYCTTPEEYACQFYEGGHTLYGAGTLPRVAGWLQALAGQLAGGPVQWQAQPGPLRFRLTARRYFPRAQPAHGQARILRQPEYQLPQGWEEGFWQVTWLDVNPALIHWHQPLVWVECSDDRGQHWQRLTDDEGAHLRLRYLGQRPQGMAAYRACWLDPEFAGVRQYRFGIASRQSGVLYSEAFGGNVLSD